MTYCHKKKKEEKERKKERKEKARHGEKELPQCEILEIKGPA